MLLASWRALPTALLFLLGLLSTAKSYAQVMGEDAKCPDGKKTDAWSQAQSASTRDLASAADIQYTRTAEENEAQLREIFQDYQTGVLDGWVELLKKASLTRTLVEAKTDSLKWAYVQQSLIELATFAEDQAANNDDLFDLSKTDKNRAVFAGINKKRIEEIPPGLLGQMRLFGDTTSGLLPDKVFNDDGLSLERAHFIARWESAFKNVQLGLINMDAEALRKGANDLFELEKFLPKRFNPKRLFEDISDIHLPPPSFEDRSKLYNTYQELRTSQEGTPDRVKAKATAALIDTIRTDYTAQQSVLLPVGQYPTAQAQEKAETIQAADGPKKMWRAMDGVKFTLEDGSALKIPQGAYFQVLESLDPTQSDATAELVLSDGSRLSGRLSKTPQGALLVAEGVKGPAPLSGPNGAGHRIRVEAWLGHLPSKTEIPVGAPVNLTRLYGPSVWLVDWTDPVTKQKKHYVASGADGDWITSKSVDFVRLPNSPSVFLATSAEDPKTGKLELTLRDPARGGVDSYMIPSGTPLVVFNPSPNGDHFVDSASRQGKDTRLEVLFYDCKPSYNPLTCKNGTWKLGRLDREQTKLFPATANTPSLDNKLTVGEGETLNSAKWVTPGLSPPKQQPQEFKDHLLSGPLKFTFPAPDGDPKKSKTIDTGYTWIHDSRPRTEAFLESEKGARVGANWIAPTSKTEPLVNPAPEPDVPRAIPFKPPVADAPVTPVNSTTSDFAGLKGPGWFKVTASKFPILGYHTKTRCAAEATTKLSEENLQNVFVTTPDSSSPNERKEILVQGPDGKWCPYIVLAKDLKFERVNGFQVGEGSLYEVNEDLSQRAIKGKESAKLLGKGDVLSVKAVGNGYNLIEWKEDGSQKKGTTLLIKGTTLTAATIPFSPAAREARQKAQAEAQEAERKQKELDRMAAEAKEFADRKAAADAKAKADADAKAKADADAKAKADADAKAKADATAKPAKPNLGSVTAGTTKPTSTSPPPSPSRSPKDVTDALSRIKTNLTQIKDPEERLQKFATYLGSSIALGTLDQAAVNRCNAGSVCTNAASPKGQTSKDRNVGCANQCSHCFVGGEKLVPDVVAKLPFDKMAETFPEELGTIKDPVAKAKFKARLTEATEKAFSGNPSNDGVTGLVQNLQKRGWKIYSRDQFVNKKPPDGAVAFTAEDSSKGVLYIKGSNLFGTQTTTGGDNTSHPLYKFFSRVRTEMVSLLNKEKSEKRSLSDWRLKESLRLVNEKRKSPITADQLADMNVFDIPISLSLYYQTLQKVPFEHDYQGKMVNTPAYPPKGGITVRRHIGLESTQEKTQKPAVIANSGGHGGVMLEDPYTGGKGYDWPLSPYMLYLVPPNSPISLMPEFAKVVDNARENACKVTYVTNDTRRDDAKKDAPPAKKPAPRAPASSSKGGKSAKKKGK